MRPGHAIVECALKHFAMVPLDLEATKLKVSFFSFDEVLNAVKMRHPVSLRETLVQPESVKLSLPSFLDINIDRSL